MAITKIGTPELFDFSATNTALQLPTGDTASRPTSPSTGEWRFNSQLKYVEYYDGTAWFQIDTESAAAFTPAENFNTNTYFGNSATQAIDAKFNEAANFNGSTSLVNLPTGVDRNNNFTLSVWVNFNTLSDYDSLITLQINYRVYVNAMADGRVFFYDGDTLSSSAGVVTTGNWYNIVVTKSSTLVGGKAIIIYVNGSEVASDNKTDNAPISSGGLNLLGAYNAGSNAFYLDGKMDQVRIFSQALTAGEAEDLYTDETTTTAATLDFPSGAGCIAAYQLDGNGNDLSTNYNGTTTDIGYTGLQFQPDLVWIKNRDDAQDSALFDSVRGVNLWLRSSTPAAQTNFGGNFGLLSFDNDGFKVGNGSAINNTGDKSVAWNWKAGGTAVSNTDGTITSQVSANTAAGFSIISYTGASGTVGHGLDSAPQMIIQKLTGGSQDWFVYIAPGVIDATSNYYYLVLNSSAGKATTGSTPPTATTFNPVSSSGNYIAYAWHSVAGYSKIGSYIGNGNNNGTVVDTGFTPRFVMIKATTTDNGGGNWLIYDSARSPSNPRNKRLYPDLNIAETTSSSYDLDFLTGATKGFQPKNGADYYGYNTLSVEYIYMAFA